jgi:hypothetical protein
VQPDASGNPAGKPPGARHAVLLALDATGAEACNDIVAAAVNAAKGGDMRAADILLRRRWSERAGRPVQPGLPAITAAVDILAALGAVAGAVARVSCHSWKPPPWPLYSKRSGGQWRWWSLNAGLRSCLRAT